MASEIISRADAKAKGLSRYFTGNACKHGHIAERQTTNGVCLLCRCEIEKRWKCRHPDALREQWKRQSARHRIENSDRVNRNKKKWAEANPEKLREKHRRWRKNNPEQDRAINRASRTKLRNANPDKFRLANKIYKAANADRLAPIAIERTKRWQADNPERHKALARKMRHNRRARMLKATGSYTQIQIDDLIERQNWICATAPCGASLRKRKELDHIVAIARGGSNEITNLQWLCPRCNRKKNAKSPAEWALLCEKLFPQAKDPAP